MAGPAGRWRTPAWTRAVATVQPWETVDRAVGRFEPIRGRVGRDDNHAHAFEAGIAENQGRATVSLMPIRMFGRRDRRAARRR